MTDKNKDNVLKALIRETIKNAGSIDPASIPHQLKNVIQGHADGSIDIDEYIREVLRENNRSRN